MRITPFDARRLDRNECWSPALARRILNRGLKRTTSYNCKVRVSNGINLVSGQFKIVRLGTGRG